MRFEIRREREKGDGKERYIKGRLKGEETEIEGKVRRGQIKDEKGDEGEKKRQNGGQRKKRRKITTTNTTTKNKNNNNNNTLP